MRTVLEHLRDLSGKHRARVKKAEEIALKMSKNAEAAAKAAHEEEK